MKNLNKFFLTTTMVVLVLIMPACKESPVELVDDIFSVVSITHEEGSSYNSGSTRITWVIQYTNNSDSQKDFMTTVEWGDGETSSMGSALSPTTTIRTDTGNHWLDHAYLLQHGAVKTWNVKITFTHSDSKISPIVQYISITTRTT